MEATNKMIESAELIEFLKSENVQLKDTMKDLETRDNVSSVSNLRNESDDVKEKIYISKLKKKVRTLTVALNGAEEMITEREKEVSTYYLLEFMNEHFNNSSILKTISNC